MENEKLECLIRNLNRGNKQWIVKISRLSASNVYLIEYRFEEDGYSPDRIYMIKNKNHEFVSAVYDMQPIDLHWCTLAPHRRMGYLKRALKDWILPDLILRHKKRGQINVSIVGYFMEEGERSFNLAKSVGFEALYDSEGGFEGDMILKIKT